ncbi:polysaccharide deacetylase family protein [Streptomyces niveiscabiei]|uniref:polysaccharide deacetylase family protein n=1 Tax=Streptomyces niveiscabiei TaxID=164115 RepID=UPI0029A40F85|nr:polysaccharide deacetylase family protein [Streptomyces niveiscabiei]MDX3384614.1 polysaccharide deacetylase family protein [Streptomyces niveiscabiei]
MRTRGLVVAVLLATLTLVTGCAQSVDPIERLGKKAAERVHGSRPGVPAGTTGTTGRTGPPAGTTGTTGATPVPPYPPVLDRVPTSDRVVFLTYDDGAERDPRFIDLVRELRLPVSMFLTDSVVGPGYGHFARLQSVGANLQNHTLHHAALRGLPYAGQRAEICGQQDKLRSRFGRRPRFFRPPYGTYDATTLRAAADCGVSAVVLWRAAMTPGGLVYPRGSHHLLPGDIVAMDSDEAGGPTLKDRTVRVLREARERGLTVGRLEDYL